MDRLTQQEYKIFEGILGLNQEDLSKFLYAFLRKYYERTWIENVSGCILAEGTIPVVLIAHMDTVFKTPATEVLYDKDKNIITAPKDGLGGDDRAGVYSIIRIVMDGYRPSVIFTTDEESGCVGASLLAEEVPECPFPNVKYLIQLDREGSCDCVFYDCANDDFEKYVEQFGFITNYGSCSDISILAPSWGMAAVNLSVGYRDNHTRSEVLFVNAMLTTIRRVEKMLSEKEIPYFVYIEDPCLWENYYNYKSGTGDTKYICHSCGKLMPDYDAIPAKLIHGGIGYFCANCLDKIDWCDECGSTYEIDPKDPTCGLCVDCKKKAKNNGGSKQKSNKKSDKRSH